MNIKNPQWFFFYAEVAKIEFLSEMAISESDIFGYSKVWDNLLYKSMPV